MRCKQREVLLYSLIWTHDPERGNRFSDKITHKTRGTRMSYFTNERTAPKPEDVKICVLYDPKDGRIAHHHAVATHGLRALEQTLPSLKRCMFPKMTATPLIGIRSTSKRYHSSNFRCQNALAQKVERLTARSRLKGGKRKASRRSSR
jgi:hypothetical protein